MAWRIPFHINVNELVRVFFPSVLPHNWKIKHNILLSLVYKTTSETLHILQCCVEFSSCPVSKGLPDPLYNEQLHYRDTFIDVLFVGFFDKVRIFSCLESDKLPASNQQHSN